MATLKTAIWAGSLNDLQLQASINTFSLLYRNATNASIGKAPSVLFKGRFLILKNLDSTKITFFSENDSSMWRTLFWTSAQSHLQHLWSSGRVGTSNPLKSNDVFPTQVYPFSWRSTTPHSTVIEIVQLWSSHLLLLRLSFYQQLLLTRHLWPIPKNSRHLLLCVFGRALV